MINQYNHLTEKDRVFLRIMLEKRYPKSRIAKILGVHLSTNYREIKRNSCTHWYSVKKFYWIHSAQNQYLKRRKRNSIECLVREKLLLDWSPEQISGYAKRHNLFSVSPERVYQFILKDKELGGKLYTHLRHQTKNTENAMVALNGKGL